MPASPRVDQLSGLPPAPVWAVWFESDTIVVCGEQTTAIEPDGTLTARSPTSPPSSPAFEGRPERAFLRDAQGHVHRLAEVEDYPVVSVSDPTGAYVWVEDKHGQGAVYSASDGAVIGSYPESPRDDEEAAVLFEGGTWARSPWDQPEHEDLSEDEFAPLAEAWERVEDDLTRRHRLLSDHYEYASPAAVVRRPDSTFWFSNDALVWSGDQRFVLGWASFVAAFDPLGSRLATVGDGEVIIVGLDSPRILARHTLHAPTITRPRSARHDELDAIAAELSRREHPTGSGWASIEPMLFDYAAELRRGEPLAAAAVLRQLHRATEQETCRSAATPMVRERAHAQLCGMLYGVAAETDRDVDAWIAERLLRPA